MLEGDFDAPVLSAFHVSEVLFLKRRPFSDRRRARLILPSLQVK